MRCGWNKSHRDTTFNLFYLNFFSYFSWFGGKRQSLVRAIAHWFPCLKHPLRGNTVHTPTKDVNRYLNNYITSWIMLRVLHILRNMNLPESLFESSKATNSAPSPGNHWKLWIFRYFIYQGASLAQAARIPLKKGVLRAAFPEQNKPQTKPKPLSNTTTWSGNSFTCLPIALIIWQHRQILSDYFQK